jgi:threonylcarbamoyladenosine tRNA methylthiotransferase MtaB
MLRAAFHTLGCKVNQYETEAMMGQFQHRGYEIVDFKDIADVYIINTCTVTHLSDRKSRQMLRKAKRNNPEALVVATGCYAQIDPDAVSEITEVDLIVGNIDKNRIVEIVEDMEIIKNRKYVFDIASVEKYEDMLVVDVHEKTRAFIKIQDGCNQFCSYCIIPYARGRVRSRAKESIRDEIQGLASKGYKEVVLTGIHIGSYGSDTGDLSLFELVKYIHDIKGIERIRLGSLEQNIIDQRFIEIVPELNKLCPHFHLSLQSGSDGVLRRMNRKYSASEYLEKTRYIRQLYPDASITTDIIVGFPEETDEEFEETLAFVKKVAFADVHVFKFSKRSGTPAATMDGQISDAIKQQRAERLGFVVDEMREAYSTKYLGETMTILFENHHANAWYGHATNYLKVIVETEKDLTNQILPVHLKAFRDHYFDGEILKV